jgi:hypothetical protein
MELNLLPQDIDKFIRDAVIKSALGKKIEETIDKAVSNCINSYDSPIAQLVKNVIMEIVKEHLSKEENRAVINEAIIKIVTPKTVENILTYGIDKLKQCVSESSYR